MQRRLIVVVIAGMLGCAPALDKTEGKPDHGSAASAAARESSASEHSPGGHPIRFEEVAAQVGLRFIPRNGEEAQHRAILETLGVGAALWDFDADGMLDVFIPGGGEFAEGPRVTGRIPALFQQRQTSIFRDAADSTGLAEDRLYSHGAYAGDYDNDGFPDLLITGYGELLLYHNQGDGTFRELSSSSGLDEKKWSTGAAWGDFNGDSTLDLYVVHYVNWSWDNHPFCPARDGQRREVCSPTLFEGVDDVLYFGDGTGAFRRADESAGIAGNGKGLAVLAGDFDLDGDLDAYVANDTTPNFFYRNNGHGRFEEVGMETGTALGESARADGSMGLDLGDFDLDGLPDIWVSNFEHQGFALYRNQGHGFFQHYSNRAGINAVGQTYVGFGTVFADFDRDGDEDLMATNGHVMHFIRDSQFRQKPLLLENQNARWFANQGDQAGAYFRSLHMGRGVASGDVDRDGDIDLVVTHTNGPVAILSNATATPYGWLQLRLVGTASARDAIGTRIEIHSDNRRQTRQLKGGRSYLSTCDLAVFVGLASKESTADLVIDWASGLRQEVSGLAANREYLVIEGSSHAFALRVP